MLHVHLYKGLTEIFNPIVIIIIVIIVLLWWTSFVYLCVLYGNRVHAPTCIYKAFNLTIKGFCIKYGIPVLLTAICHSSAQLD